MLVIWAASNGYTDDIAVDDVRPFEAELLRFVENSHPGLLQNIREQKSLTDEIKSDLQQVLKDVKDEWNERAATSAGVPVTAAAAAAPRAPAGA